MSDSTIMAAPPVRTPAARADTLDPNLFISAAQAIVSAGRHPVFEVDAFLAEVLRQVALLAPFDMGWVLLREGDRARIRATDPSHRGDVNMTFPVDDCVSGLSMLRGAPILIADLAQMPDELRRVYKASRSVQTAMRSELVIPLMSGPEAIGALNIESRRPGAFAWHHAAQLSLLADQAALAIDLARSREEAAALGAISLQLARETELQAVVRTVLQRALGLIAGEFGQLLLVEGADLVVYYTTNVPPREAGVRFKIGESVSGLAVQARKPVIVPDVNRADYFVVESAMTQADGRARLLPRATDGPRYQRVLERERERIHAELAVPLWVTDRVWGVLNVETPDAGGFSPAQRADLVALGEAAGERFGAALAHPDERRPAALRAFLDEALAHADTAFGQLLEADGDDLVIVQTTGGEPLGTRVAVASSVSGQALARRDEVYVPDVSREPLYRRYLGEEMKSELAVPLISRRSPSGDDDQVLGVLNLESPVPGFFTAEHARILQALASQAAVAIERARRTEVERLAAIGGLAGDIVHRLNNPIGAISGWVDTLERKPFYGELVAAYPYVAQFVGRVARDVARAKSIIQELRREIRHQAPGAVALQPAIQGALERTGLADDGRIRLHLALPAEPVRVLAGPGLTGVFWNLFDNARKAMPGGGALTVTVHDAGVSGWVVVEVADTGVGIESWRLPTIFEAGESTTADSYAPAHGLGLWWTRGQIDSFSGQIEVASEPGAGTRFIIRLRAAA